MKKEVNTLVLCGLAIVINIVLGSFVSSIKIPLLFLDSLGTIYIAATKGVKWSLVVGILTNLLLGILTTPIAIPFALVSVLIAIVVSLMAKRGFSYKRAILTGILLSITIPLVATPIRIYLFGGLSGSGSDVLLLVLKKTGQSLFGATALTVFTANLVDKVVSCVLVSFMMKRLAKFGL